MLEKHIIHPTAHSQENVSQECEMVHVVRINGDLRDDAARQIVFAGIFKNCDARQHLPGGQALGRLRIDQRAARL